MDLMLQLVRWETEFFLFALGGIVVFQLLTGQINTSHLLDTKLGPSRGAISPERVQLLVMTLGAAFYFVMQTATTAKSGVFPDIPQTWPALMGGSNAIYLSGKAYARWSTNKQSDKES
jgi:hypothetical protein